MRLEFDSNTSVPTIAENDIFIEAGEQVDFAELLSEGIKAAQAGRRAEARSFLLTVTESEPDNEAAWLWLASISEYPEELLGFLNNVLRINPENERALEWRNSTKALLSKTFVQRGIEASKENRKDFARQCFRQALYHNDQSDMAWLWLAACADSDDEKKGYLQKALDANPENEQARASLDALRRQSAETLLQQAFDAAAEGENERASELLEEAMSRDAGNENAWMLKSTLAQSVAEKLECFEKVLEFNPNNSLAASNLEFLRSMKSTAQNHLDEPVAESNEADFDDVSPTGELEFSPNPVDEDENYFAEEFQAEENLEEQNLENEPETAEDFFAADEPEAAGFDDAEYEAEAENVGEVEELPQVYAYEESAETEEAQQESEEAAAFYSDAPENDEDMFEASPEAFESEADEIFSAEAEPETEFAAEEEENPFSDKPEEIFAEESVQPEMIACPFCDAENEMQTFACSSCGAVYSLSDIEKLLAPGDVNKEIVSEAVRLTEAEAQLRDLDVDELKFLAVGHFNLKHPQRGISYLSEAARLNHDDILLASQLNALKIRLSEIDRKQNNHDAMPKNMTILVADDSATVRKLISGKLEKCGHSVVCAIDGVDALEKLNEIEPDLVLLDINMPRMDGYQVCKHIRGNDSTKDVPVVMISGKDGFFDKVRGRMAGTTGYITKPFGPETLMKTVETYVGQPA